MLHKMIKKAFNVLSRSPMAEPLYYGPKRNKILRSGFLLSDKYKKLMQRNAGDLSHFESFGDDAEITTDNYRFRHSPHIQKQLGSWRWKAMYQYRDQLVPLIFGEGRKGIDLGGAYGPVSKDAVIVDFAKQDIFGRPVKYKYLDEIDLSVDFIYASHTLEHIRELDNLAAQIRRLLKPGGDLIVLVPSWSCVSWRVGNHTNLLHNDHVWTFYLSGTPIHEPINNLFAIDTFLEKYFRVVLKEYTGDNSILLLAKRD